MHHPTVHPLSDDPCDGEAIQPEQPTGIGVELGLDTLILRRLRQARDLILATMLRRQQS
ncbi:protein of unknown function [Blastococcus saxobsidens DD2]|uniref:Uncharacterized protein n=1 Tax=Blastococcus saxobsidens (strain DD2) TaxID=1146883 RepID=H6RNT7_BLASD|nr:protein of unknown function [Blastococcus saxobsidens DD2]